MIYIGKAKSNGCGEDYYISGNRTAGGIRRWFRNVEDLHRILKKDYSSREIAIHSDSICSLEALMGYSDTIE